MEKFNYYYDGTPITKKQFLNAVPGNWAQDVNKDGQFSYGSYRAIKLEDEQ